jgi:hypothetical protein
MFYLRYLCLILHSDVQHILCCVFVLFVKTRKTGVSSANHAVIAKTE